QRIEAVAAAHVAHGHARLDSELRHHERATLFPLALVADQPFGAGKVHGLRDRAAFVRGQCLRGLALALLQSGVQPGGVGAFTCRWGVLRPGNRRNRPHKNDDGASDYATKVDRCDHSPIPLWSLTAIASLTYFITRNTLMPPPTRPRRLA